MSWDFSEQDMERITRESGAAAVILRMQAKTQRDGNPLPLSALDLIANFYGMRVEDSALEFGADAEEAKRIGEVARETLAGEIWRTRA
jgi:hypothetical protein